MIFQSKIQFIIDQSHSLVNGLFLSYSYKAAFFLQVTVSRFLKYGLEPPAFYRGIEFKGLLYRDISDSAILVHGTDEYRTDEGFLFFVGIVMPEIDRAYHAPSRTMK